MRFTSVAFTLFSFIFAPQLSAQEFRFQNRRIDKDLVVRVGVLAPDSGHVRGDVIYLHGFADRFDNHTPLFKELAGQGFRVISFDLPSHGETEGSSINWYDFSDLSALVSMVETMTREDVQRPLFIVGWSTGGLLAVRMAQHKAFDVWDRRPQGFVLHAPAIAINFFPGEWGRVTKESLTSNPQAPHVAPPKPSSPYKTPLFGASLLMNSVLAGRDSMPSEYPVLTVVGGDTEDQYLDSVRLRYWIFNQRRLSKAHLTQLFGLRCPSSKHALDNEISPIGETVRAHTVWFLNAILNKNLTGYSWLPAQPGCQSF